jgi:hypothetical protein
VQFGPDDTPPVVDAIRANGAAESVPEVSESEEVASEAGRRASQQDAVRVSVGQENERALKSGADLSQYNGKGAPVSASEINRATSGAASAELGNTPSDEQSQKQAEEEAKQEEVAALKERDQEVRRHENAHKSVLGQHAAGGIQYELTTGPDGGQYAVGGSVPVDLSEEEEPEETIAKAQTIKRAALAPAEPSSADRSVAAQASQLEASGRQKLQEEGEAETQGVEGSEQKSAPDVFSKIASLQETDEVEGGAALLASGGDRRGGNRLSIRV